MMLAFIGGSGFYDLPDMEHVVEREVTTDYGLVRLKSGQMFGQDLVFMCRHGDGHNVPPHKINYRANMQALANMGVQHVIAFNAVGGIADFSAPESLILPNQVIDYTWRREHTFYDAFAGELSHVDFSLPFDESLRQLILSALGSDHIYDGGCYACTQGPRLESAAEIRRLRNDGCDLVGMTLMPEAALARELNMAYASICFSVNWAAGLQADLDIKKIQAVMQRCVATIKKSIPDVVSAYRNTYR